MIFSSTWLRVVFAWLLLTHSRTGVGLQIRVGADEGFLTVKRSVWTWMYFTTTWWKLQRRCISSSGQNQTIPFHLGPTALRSLNQTTSLSHREPSPFLRLTSVHITKIHLIQCNIILTINCYIHYLSKWTLCGLIYMCLNYFNNKFFEKLLSVLSCC